MISVKKMVVVGGGGGDFHMLHSFIMHTCVCENFILENGGKQIVLCEMAAREVSLELFVTLQDFIYSLKRFY